MLSFELEIISPEGVFLKKEVKMVTMPGFDGVLGVCADHIPMMVVLDQGILTIYDEASQPLDNFFVGSGFAEITGKSVIVMVDEASDLKEYKLEEVKVHHKKYLEEKITDEIDYKINEKEIAKWQILIDFLSSYKA